MLIIINFILAFIAFFIATMMTFQGNLPVPVAVIISALAVAFFYWFTNGIVDMPYLWHK
ncbi:hypothetical protein ACMTF7_001785 [Campylobacter jejuni]